jgi:cell division protein FtsW (lipid II flippase)
VFSQEGSLPTVFLGFVSFTAGWFAAQRFGRPTGLSNRPPWLDTVLPIAIAAFAILPAALYPFLGTVSIAVAAAIVVLFFAGMSLSLGLGPYSNVKVALSTKG